MISKDFLNREENQRQEKEEQRRKQKELDKLKKKIEVKSQDKLKWIREGIGCASKKELVEKGGQVIPNLKTGDFEEAFGSQWDIGYFGRLDKFLDIFGEEQGRRAYFNCLMEKKHREVLGMLEKKGKKVKKSKVRNLDNFFKEKTENEQSKKLKSKKMNKTVSDKIRIKMKKDPNNLRTLEEHILILGTGCPKKKFDTFVVSEIKKKFNYFSERKINMKVKELLRFGYLVSREVLFEFLSDHDNQYKLNNMENLAENNLLTMFKKSRGEDNQQTVNRKIVEDFVYGEGIFEKLFDRFSPKEKISKIQD